MILTMEFQKFYMQMEEEGMGSYLEKMVSNSIGRNSWNLRLNFWAQLGKYFKCYIMFWIFLLFIENFENFENFYLLFYSLDRF